MSSRTPPSNLRLLLLFLTALLLQTLYLQHTLHPSHPHPPPRHSKTPSPSNTPEVFIYRRTKKTGSSSMLDALLHALHPYNYTTLYSIPEKLPTLVRIETHHPHPRRLLIAQHNGVTRAHTAPRHTVIADTIMDGYKQVTSFCRFVLEVPDCGAAMEACLASKGTQGQMRYRWAGREREDEETYIDLPLSAAHPALSTTVLRRVYEGVVLDVKKFNVQGSACGESERLRRVYGEHFGELEKQVEGLRKRMLVLGGYPVRGVGVGVGEMMERAEELERGKYDLGRWEEVREASGVHKGLKRGEGIWKRVGGEVVLA